MSTQKPVCTAIQKLTCEKKAYLRYKWKREAGSNNHQKSPFVPQYKMFTEEHTCVVAVQKFQNFPAIKSDILIIHYVVRGNLGLRAFCNKMQHFSC